MENFRKVCLPYCLRRLEDGRYLLLNRYYLPVGVCTESHHSESALTHIDRHAFKLRGIGPKIRQMIDINGQTDGDIYLYRESCTPGHLKPATDAYLEKLRTILHADS